MLERTPLRLKIKSRWIEDGQTHESLWKSQPSSFIPMPSWVWVNPIRLIFCIKQLMNHLINSRGLARVLAIFMFCVCAHAQTSPTPQALSDVQTTEAQQGKTLLQSKCAQCHTDSIWRDQRQDARAWEATLYRMMGRGAVWSGSDIHAMATYLATDFGTQSPRVFTPQ